MNSHLCINEKYVFALIISFWYTRLNSYTDFWQIYIDSVIGIVCRFYIKIMSITIQNIYMFVLYV